MHTLNRLATVACLLLSAALAAQAPQNPIGTGERFLASCPDTAEGIAAADVNDCLPYFIGFLDGSAFAHGRLEADEPFCEPDDSDYASLYLVLMRFLQTHPQVLELPLSTLIYDALSEAFPCPPAGTPGSPLTPKPRPI